MKEEEMFVGDPFDKYFAVGWMKRYTEKMCEMYATKVNNPMTCIVLRPTNIYGPNDKIEPDRSHVLTALIRKVIEKQNPIQVWGDGTDIRDVLYVDDMVDAMILSAETVEGFKQYNVGYGAAFSVLELLNYIKKVENIHVDHVLVPTAPRMIPIRKVSIEKINKELGWYPKTPLTLGIQKTYDWVKHVLSV
jgi:GDP-L-fucose synthase